MTPLTADEVRALLAPGEAADDLLLLVLDALRRAGHGVVVTDAYGLGAQADLARTHARLMADPDLAEADRRHQINRLGKINPAAGDQEEEVLERLRTRALAFAGRARADWRNPEHLARQALPGERHLEEIAGELRRSVSAAAALAPDHPRVRELLDLADRITR